MAVQRLEDTIEYQQKHAHDLAAEQGLKMFEEEQQVNELARQKASLQRRGLLGKAGEIAANVGERAAYTIADLLGAFDVTGASHNILAQQGIQSRFSLPVVPPEAVKEDAATMGQFLKEGLHLPTTAPVEGPAAPVVEGLKQAGAETVSALTSPSVLGPVGATKLAPYAVQKVIEPGLLKTFQYQMIGGIPRAAQEYIEAPNVEESVRRGAGLGVAAVLPSVLNKGIAPFEPSYSIPYARGTALKIPPGAKPPFVDRSRLESFQAHQTAKTALGETTAAEMGRQEKFRQIVAAQKMVQYGTSEEQAMGMEMLKALRGPEPVVEPVEATTQKADVVKREPTRDISGGFLKTAEDLIRERSEPTFLDRPEWKGLHKKLPVKIKGPKPGFLLTAEEKAAGRVSPDFTEPPPPAEPPPAPPAPVEPPKAPAAPAAATPAPVEPPAITPAAPPPTGPKWHMGVSPAEQHLLVGKDLWTVRRNASDGKWYILDPRTRKAFDFRDTAEEAKDWVEAYSKAGESVKKPPQAKAGKAPPAAPAVSAAEAGRALTALPAGPAISKPTTKPQITQPKFTAGDSVAMWSDKDRKHIVVNYRGMTPDGRALVRVGESTLTVPTDSLRPIGTAKPPLVPSGVAITPKPPRIMPRGKIADNLLRKRVLTTKGIKADTKSLTRADG